MVVGRVWRVSGPLVVAENMSGSMIYEVVYIGVESLVGEIIGIQGDKAFIQVYEDTSGLSVGDPVEGSGKLLSAELGPGLIGKVFDGLQRPLSELEVLIGPFVRRGVKLPSLPRNVKWFFRRERGLEVGAKVGPNDILGYVDETPLITHKIMVPPNVSGYLKELVADGDYSVDEVVARVERSGEVFNIKMFQEWPIRKARPYIRRLEPTELLVTGTRVLDALFPIAVGGKAAVPGGFGSGKCVLPGTPVLLADWSLKSIDEIYREARGKKLRINEYEEVVELDEPLDVIGFDGVELRVFKATHIYRGFTSSIVELRTSSGRVLKVTPEHKLPVLDHYGNLTFIDAQNVSPGTYLVVPRYVPVASEYVGIPMQWLLSDPEVCSRDYEYNERVRNLLKGLSREELEALSKASNIDLKTIKNLMNSRTKAIPLKLVEVLIKAYPDLGLPKILGVRRGKQKLSIPDKVDEDLAELLGLLLSSGSISGDDVMFYSNDIRVVQRYISLVSRIFNLRCREETSGRAYHVKIHSPLLVKVFKALGASFNEALNDLEVPEVIMKSPERVVSAFIRGLYLGCGSFDEGRVRLVVKSPKLLRGLAYLMLKLGIKYSAEFRDQDELNYIYICEPNELRKFCVKVLLGRGSDEIVLKTAGFSGMSDQELSGSGVGYNLQALVHADRVTYGLVSYDVSAKPLTFLEGFEDVVDTSTYVALDMVKDVRVLKYEGDVYDLVVDSVHNFVGGDIPVIYHNTVLLQTLTKWSRTNVNIYVGCGERGNEMADALHSFRKLVDPVSGRPLYEKAVFIANTSNMPVAARETSVFLGATLGEYFRDMGYDVLLVADSTSRWAEAMREISARMEEMPGEEGFPAYLGSRLAQFYERSGRVECIGNPKRYGSLTIVGAVSPPGADFSEPVTQNTLRYIGTLIALDVSLANRRHFPSVSWLLSYSLYVDNVSTWWSKLNNAWSELRREFLRLLQKEAELMEIVRLVGPDALPEEDKLVLEVSRMIREDFLQQSAYHPVDSYSPPEKTLLMMDIIVRFYKKAYDALLRGVPLSSIKGLPVRAKIARMKEEDPKEFSKFYSEVVNEIEESISKLIEVVG
ncbi:MAG: V-type ATP synthase subunit A [Sulfolobales archaeon]